MAVSLLVYRETNTEKQETADDEHGSAKIAKMTSTLDSEGLTFSLKFIGSFSSQRCIKIVIDVGLGKLYNASINYLFHYNIKIFIFIHLIY